MFDAAKAHKVAQASKKIKKVVGPRDVEYFCITNILNGRMITFPNAKINIGLDILRRRPDGYHDISTLMVPVGWTDILEILPGTGDSDTLTVTGRKVDCPPEKNLVMKAVKALRKRRGFPPVDMWLRKIIPDGAGLGGGSADASFAIKTVNSMFGLGLDNDGMAEVAAEIGSDCPFFIYNVPMLCTGTGTTLLPSPFKMPENMTVVIVKPPVSVPTAHAYARVSPAEPAVPLPVLIDSIDVEMWQGRIKNDFEDSVFPAYPAVAAVKDALIKAGAVYASMSGSGSAVYGLFRKGDIMADDIKAICPGCDIFVN